MVIIRNRVIALVTRILLLAGLTTFFALYFLEMSPAWRALCFLEIQACIAYMVFLFFEVIFNAIDLRHGVKGIAAGGFLPLMLLLTGYCFISSALYFSYIMPVRSYLTLRSIMFHSALFVIPLLNWLLFEIKGTVRYYYAFISIAYPMIYVIFSIFRAVIWPNNALYTPDVMFIYDFFDPSEKAFLWSPWVSIVAVIAFFALMILFNNLLARKGRRKIPNLF